jgi:hypothetical protein
VITNIYIYSDNIIFVRVVLYRPDTFLKEIVKKKKKKKKSNGTKKKKKKIEGHTHHTQTSLDHNPRSAPTSKVPVVQEGPV